MGRTRDEGAASDAGSGYAGFVRPDQPPSAPRAPHAPGAAHADAELSVAADFADPQLAFAQFLARLSHELRTPLTAILGFAELLRDGVPGHVNERQRTYLDHILLSGGKLLDRLQELADLAAIDEGRRQLDRRWLAPAARLRELCARQQGGAAQRGVELVLELVEPLPAIEAEERAFDQIVCQLLDQALRCSPVGEKVTLSAREVRLGGDDASAAGTWLEVAVADHALLPRADRLQLFDALERPGPDEVWRERGAGLGLALARRLVELHGGATWARPVADGVGGVLGFRLPLRSLPRVETPT